MKIVITILWVFIGPLGIGAIVYHIRKSSLLGALAGLLAVITCSSPCWTRKLFNWLGPVREALRSDVYTFLSILFPLLIIASLLIQTFVINSKIRLRARIVKVVLKLPGLVFIVGYSFYVSARKVERGFDYLYQSLIERSRPFIDSVTIVLTASAEGLEVLFVFLLAFLSGYLLYPSTNNFKFSKRLFMILMIFIGWLIVVSINEAFIQRLWMSGRELDCLDILHNMVGVSVGLALSIGVFWKRQK